MITWRLFRIRHLRTKESLKLGRAVTQQDLGNAVGAHRVTIARYEGDQGGDIQNPDLEIMSRIAQHFEVPLSYFYDEEGEDGIVNKNRAIPALEMAHPV